MLKKYIHFSILIAILLSCHAVHATTYNYLPNDVYIKQQEEKSALEYRLRTIESQIGGSNPTFLISNIEYRISELISERDTEKNYVTGLYGKNGIANQLPVALDKIDAKYTSQISNLQNQRSYYQDQISKQSDTSAEREKILQRLKELDEQYNKKLEENNKKIEELNKKIFDSNGSIYSTTGTEKIPTALEIFTILDSLTEIKLANVERLQSLKIKNFNLYTEVLKLAEDKYFKGKTDPNTMFVYMDTLSQSELYKLNSKLELFNPILKNQVNDIVRRKYPNGKTFTTPTSQNTPVESKLQTTPKNNLTIRQQDELNMDISTTTTTNIEIQRDLESVIDKPAKVENIKSKENIIKRFWRFFKGIF
jgi:hypothetical protein